MASKVAPAKTRRWAGNIVGRELALDHGDALTVTPNRNKVEFWYGAELALRYIHNFELKTQQHKRLDAAKLAKMVETLDIHDGPLTIQRGKLQIPSFEWAGADMFKAVICADIQAFDEQGNVVDIVGEQQRLAAEVFGPGYTVRKKLGSMAFGILITNKFGQAMSATQMLEKRIPTTTTAGPVKILPTVHIPRPR